MHLAEIISDGVTPRVKHLCTTTTTTTTKEAFLFRCTDAQGATATCRNNDKGGSCSHSE